MATLTKYTDYLDKRFGGVLSAGCHAERVAYFQPSQGKAVGL